jgi:hypothetical protein
MIQQTFQYPNVNYELYIYVRPEIAIEMPIKNSAWLYDGRIQWSIALSPSSLPFSFTIREATNHKNTDINGFNLGDKKQKWCLLGQGRALSLLFGQQHC